MWPELIEKSARAKKLVILPVFWGAHRVRHGQYLPQHPDHLILLRRLLWPALLGNADQAASDPGRNRRRQTKEQPAAPVLPIVSVVTILTPPGPCRPGNPPASSVQSSQPIANQGVGKSVVQRQPTCQPAGTGWIARIMPAATVNLVVTVLPIAGCGKVTTPV